MPPKDYKSLVPDISADKVLAASSHTEGERKHLTVMFADISGSLNLIEGLDPEQVLEITQTAVQTMSSAVHMYGGTVTRTMGDGILALFGAPISHEDHAIRACFAALRMRQEARALGIRVGEIANVQIRFHIGLSSGEVLVRTISNDLTLEYDVVGSTVHIANRMESLAAADSILMTASTANLVQEAFETKPCGEVKIRGLTNAVRVFELVATLEQDAVSTRSPRRRLSPFISRRAELAQLRHAIAAANSGSGRIFAVTGEPGIGKSRLAYEFISSAPKNWRKLTSSCSAYGTQVPYYPFLKLVKQVFNIGDLDVPSKAIDKLKQGLRKLQCSEDLATPLLALLNIPASETWDALEYSQRRMLMHSSVTTLMAEISKHQPILLLIEDLHWIEPDSNDLLHELVRTIHEHRILLIVNFRPEFRPAWINNLHLSLIELKPFVDTELTEFLNQTFGDGIATEGLKALLSARMGGNPLFLEEAIRELLDTGYLTQSSNGLRLTRPITDLSIPESIHAIIAARLDHASSHEKRILQEAAVIGDPFEVDILCALSTSPSQEVLSQLMALQDRGFIYEMQRGVGHQYAFKHALTHEVTYSTLTKKRQRELHVKVMRTIEKVYEDHLTDFADRLVNHARHGQKWHDSVIYSRIAGQQALARSANEQAATRFREALDLVGKIPDPEDQLTLGVDLRCDLRNSLELIKPETLIASLSEALQKAEQLKDERRVGTVASYLAHAYWVNGKLAKAIEYGKQGMRIGAAISDISIEIPSVYHLGLAYLGWGRFLQARELLEHVVERAPKYDRLGLNIPPAVLARSYLARTLAEMGCFNLSKRYTEECVALAEEIGSPYARGFGYLAAGHRALILGDYESAIPPLERSHASFLESGTLVMAPAVAAFLGRAYNFTGKISLALRTLEEAVETTRAMRIRVQQPLRMVFLSEALQNAKRIEEAKTIAKKALSCADKQREQASRAYALHQIGRLTAENFPGNPEALSYLRKAYALSNKLLLRPLAARCRNSIARSLQRGNSSTPEINEERDAADIARAELGIHQW